VDYATADLPCAISPCPGIAESSEDYEPRAGTLTFAPGETMKTFPVPIVADSVFEGNETFLVNLSNVQGGATLGSPSQAVLTIIDANRSVKFSAPAYTVNEGSVATITVVRGGSTTGAVTVHYSTGNDSAMSSIDYVAKSGTLTFGAGITSQTFTVTTVKRAD